MSIICYRLGAILPQPINRPSEVKLYFCPLLPSLMTEKIALMIRQWLPQDEQAKVDRYIQPSAQTQGLMVRGYLRALLSRHSSMDPHEWQFEYGEKGKPRLTSAQFALTGINFNVSHSGDWLLVAIVQQPKKSASLPLELGVDIERCRSRTNIHSILRHYFSELETAALLALPSEQQRDRFFDLWALKESYIKAKGLGLALPLTSFGFDLLAIKQSTLMLQSSDNTPPELQQTGFTEQMLFKQQIGLQFFAKQSLKSDNSKLGADKPIDAAHFNAVSASEADAWHCALGHLNDKYRFAVSVYDPLRENLPITYQAEVVDLKSIGE